MPNTVQLPIIAGNLPAGFCPPDYQTLLATFAGLMFAQLTTSGGSSPVASGFVISPTKPTDTTVAWQQLDTLGRPTRLYLFAQGAWLSLHPTAPGLTMWWFNGLPNFTTFDGGDANPLSPISGPMWQQALDASGNLIAAKFPIVAGTLPSTTILNVGNTGGEEQHTLSAAEIAPHTHDLDNCGFNAAPQGGLTLNNPAGPIAGDRTKPSAAQGGPIHSLPNTGNGSSIAAPHNTMPPYIVGYLLQRSNRLYYSVS
jgi:hypothetical protein